MHKNRTVILFGAGAVIPWGGPSTSYLTNLIIDSAPAFVCNDDHTEIMLFISNVLKNSGYKDDFKELNFETLINVIEEFIIHYAYFDGEKELSSLNKIFFLRGLKK